MFKKIFLLLFFFFFFSSRRRHTRCGRDWSSDVCSSDLVGHATVLIQIGPYNFLTDPVWCEYAGPQQGRGPKRICPAGIALEELPTIHAVLLSHNHYDHMDLATLRWLHARFAMPIYTGLEIGRAHV